MRGGGGRADGDRADEDGGRCPGFLAFAALAARFCFRDDDWWWSGLLVVALATFAAELGFGDDHPWWWGHAVFAFGTRVGEGCDVREEKEACDPEGGKDRHGGLNEGRQRAPLRVSTTRSVLVSYD